MIADNMIKAYPGDLVSVCELCAREILVQDNKVLYYFNDNSCLTVTVGAVSAEVWNRSEISKVKSIIEVAD